MDNLEAWRRQAREHRGITRELAAFVAGLRPGDVPKGTRAVLGKALVDALGCGLYGLATPWGRIMAGFARELQGPAEAALWGGGVRISAVNSVLAGGTAIHGFDFDDHSRAKIHPGALVVPVALALAERQRSRGEVILAAMAAGYETMNRVSQAANPGRARMRGWHLTGTTGTLAAAATASVMLGLDADTTASALGLAGTQSAGTWAFTADGGMSKRMHPGRSAQAGVMAALLAQRGFAGPHYILEAEDGGLLFGMSDTPRPEKLTEELGSRWHADETCFKPHACCGSNHACIDAALALMREHGLQVADVTRVVAGVASVVETQTGFEYRADSVLNAQMSLRYNVAVAMYDGQAYLEQFTPERIVEPGVVALARRVEVEIDPQIDRAYPEIYGGKVTLVTRDGRTLSKQVDYSRGMPENPMGHDEIERKFLSLASAAVGAEHARRVLAAANALFDSASAEPLARLMMQAEVRSGASATAQAA
ncbi:MmgE/PrpD family protein [Cupriavidus oxalaticus]|uniref:2-Methylcitrate dehydratase n=1 Tax=Cupriavidus oxalaticus TaxID=96344 RepID=A0A375G3D4_9BURK|nr:MmgE/PrpD family protein [Cupriavidus oxalaticus]WQD84381.1 MmgE/PrpD family protein [Cupriavidus oxalaticus]SPC12279.1 2-Methylcitrate dehydratase [Cupriavidus oxalaticus]